MIKTTVKITDPMGIHLRPAGALCEAAVRFPCKITLIYQKESGSGEANAKSVLGILGAGIGPGESVEICCDGPEEEEAAKALREVFEKLSRGVD